MATLTRTRVLARALRLPFLSASAAAVLLGWVTARYGGAPLNPLTAGLTLAGALLAHGGINVLNDYYDHLNGTDAANRSAVAPYTGGSRVIQEGLLTPAAMGRLGTGLLILAGVMGLLLLPVTGPALLVLGAPGLLIGWAYSAPPLCLAGRGLGEPAVVLGFGLFLPLGADLVQRDGWDAAPLAAGLPYGLLVAALLLINEFPDRAADGTTGKRTWVVRLGPDSATWIYPALLAGAGAVLAAAVMAGVLPGAALLGGIALVPGLAAAVLLRRHRHRPARLRTAIRLTLAAALLYALGLTAVLLTRAPQGPPVPAHGPDTASAYTASGS